MVYILVQTPYIGGMANLILASQSVHRRQLLKRLGVPFTTQPAHIDESEKKGETPLQYVRRIAMGKARAAAAKNPGKVVLAADTPVCVGRRILQTPQTEEEAAQQLRYQSGRRVNITTVVVGIGLDGKAHEKVCKSWVKMKKLAEAEIQAYVKNHDNWSGSSGAIKLNEHGADAWFTQIHGSISGIIGLPLYETALILKRCGIALSGITLPPEPVE